MLIEGTDGKMVIINSPKGNVMIALIGTRDMNLGMARLTLNDAMKEIDELL